MIAGVADESDLLFRALLEGSYASIFTARRAQAFHNQHRDDAHLLLKNFFYGGGECPWCETLLCSSSV